MGNSGDTFYVPEDITTNIFRHLPVKSLLRFRCVCKSWRDLILSDQFVNSHINDVRSRVIFFTYDYQAGTVMEGKLERLMKMKLSETMQIESYHQIFGHCNGIICLWDFISDDILLWNPAMRQCRVLPPPMESVWLTTGFGYDARNQDYKVVTISSRVSEVYSLRSNTWKQCSNLGLQSGRQFITIYCPGCIFKGCLHWIVDFSVYHDQKPIYFLIAFDLTSDELLEFEIPESVCENHNLAVAFSLGVFNGRLSLVTGNGKDLEIWSMQDHYWTKACRFSFEEVCADDEFRLSSVGLIVTEGGEVWIMADPVGGKILDNGVVYLCDIQMNNRLKARRVMVDYSNIWFPVPHYLDTLVSLQ